MKTRGRKHTFSEKLLMEQVAEEFQKKKRQIGAKRAAEQLNICLASFYKYATGKNLPRMEVLRDAHKKWGIKWNHIDSSQFVRIMRLASPEQHSFPFLDAVQEKDVKIAKIEREGKNVLRVALKIRFSA